MNRKLVGQIIRFGFVGGVAFLIDYGMLFVISNYLGINYLIASAIAFSISVIVNYILNDLIVFKMKKAKTTIVLFVMISLFGLCVNQLIMWIVTEKMNMYYMFSKILATLVVMCWNFVMRKILLEDK